jgi:hypothetical protein
VGVGFLCCIKLTLWLWWNDNLRGLSLVLVVGGMEGQGITAGYSSFFADDVAFIFLSREEPGD